MRNVVQPAGSESGASNAKSLATTVATRDVGSYAAEAAGAAGVAAWVTAVESVLGASLLQPPRAAAAVSVAM